MFYLRPSTDFFGPKASQFRDFMDEKVFVHLIPQCGMRIVKAIDILASAIVASKVNPYGNDVMVRLIMISSLGK